MRRVLPALLVLALAGCSEPPVTCEDPPCVDAAVNPDDRDGDGFVICGSAPSPGCDCDDAAASINPAAADVCEDGIDQDCDGVDAPCDRDGDSYTSNVDCDDEDAEVNPGATEVCNGIDDDCNGLIDELDECRAPDLDADGVEACSGPTGSDCDCNDCDSGVFGGPDARERCADGVDGDCDGSVDEGCPDPADDADGDGQAPPLDCDDTDPFAYTHDPGEPVIDRCGNGIAGSCIPGEDRPCSEDLDGDGFVEPGACEGDATRGPLVAEVCNGIDDDCDGYVDETGPSPDVGCSLGDVIDYATDFGSCGGCRVACDVTTADRCVDGTCDCSSDASEVGPCTAGRACCAAGCVDLETDAANCGGCGVACDAGQTCVAGTCS